MEGSPTYFLICFFMMFGNQLQKLWGPIKFLTYYLTTGIGAGILIYLFSDGVTIGASGAVMVILFAYGYIYPNQMLFCSYL